MTAAAATSPRQAVNQPLGFFWLSTSALPVLAPTSAPSPAMGSAPDPATAVCVSRALSWLCADAESFRSALARDRPSTSGETR